MTKEPAHILEIENLGHAYPGHGPTFSHLNFQLEQNEMFCLLGPSGCGKSTLFQCLAGFEPLTHGKILLKRRDISQLPPEKRGIGLVFQDYALFPHLKISQNISYGLRHFKKEDKEKRVDELLGLFNLVKHKEKFPHELSGGEQQRVAIARAMAPGPELILFDEAFSNLDPSLRQKLRLELKDLLKKTKTSAIFITHDQEEAFDLGDRIGILYDKKLQQVGTPFELYHNPATEFMARFIGSNQFIDGECLGDEKVKTTLGELRIQNNQNLKEVLVYLPHSSFKIVGPENGHSAQIKRKSFRGETYCYDVFVPELGREFSQIRDMKDYDLDQEVGLRIETDALTKVFPKYL